ncbi:MAG: hypothetical protein HY735_37195 [Verrucomicrobia bacterium]|nr:hypothetical protein [Verrucomicrobiota bacterium]
MIRTEGLLSGGARPLATPVLVIASVHFLTAAEPFDYFQNSWRGIGLDLFRCESVNFVP